ncbi:MAG: hypothetical protein A2Y40_02035 [Candidatus Margulisbacteria bacterium GWF2_35_9]|nr:MAG: hypothetical protein A2Y40_02035 [Candidatus Margulisbacteria bacterium GWF2_35_9]
MNEQMQYDMACLLDTQGQVNEAVELFRQIIAINPNHMMCHYKLANICIVRGETEAAISHYNKILDIKPDFYEANYMLGIIFKDLGKEKEAIIEFQKAIDGKPELVESYFGMVECLIRDGQKENAIKILKRIIQIKPHFSEAYFNLGVLFEESGQLQPAISNFKKAIKLNPNNVMFYYNLANVLKRNRDFPEAILYFQAALRLKNDSFEIHYNLANTYNSLANYDQAIDHYQQVIKLRPDFVAAYFNLGNVYKDTNRNSEAVIQYETVIKLKPDFVEACNNLGQIYYKQGNYGKAMDQYRNAIRVRPNYHQAYSNYLYLLNFDHQMKASEIFNEHKHWAEQFKSLSASVTISEPHNNNILCPLCIGYVSADFRVHSVAYFISQIVKYHNHKKYKIICYSTTSVEDEMTNWFKKEADLWRNIDGKTDEEASEMIKKDKVNILVDLSGHTAFNRITLFTKRNAPVQVSYLGYPNTTGLKTLDYRITDHYADPLGETEKYYTEELTRLPESFICYQAPESCPQIENKSLHNKKSITFGSFNQLIKINEQVLDLWIKILHSVPESKLILKNKSFTDDDVTKEFKTKMMNNGIDSTRLSLIGYLPKKSDHFALYNKMDIVLDTFPYNGATTTCEALWMGCPVITLAGAMHVSRVGVSILNNIGLPQLVANSVEDYLKIAVRIANDREELEHLHKSLRSKMERSILKDGKQIVSSLEMLYEEMIRKKMSAIPVK